MKIARFEDLEVWKVSLGITQKIYEITGRGAYAKDYPLRDQTRKSVISVSSNIAEGFEKNNNNEFIRYLLIAKGSVGELRSQLHIARAIHYLTDQEFESMNLSLQKLAQQIGALISYLSDNRRTREFNTKATR